MPPHTAQAVLFQSAKNLSSSPCHSLPAADLWLWLTDTSFPVHKLKTELFPASTQQKKTFVGLLKNIFSQQEVILPFSPSRTKGEMLFPTLADGLRTIPEGKASG